MGDRQIWITTTQWIGIRLRSLGTSYNNSKAFRADAQDLSALMGRIALAGKMVAKRLTQAGLVEDALGFTGRTNVQGEAVKRMDLFANQVFISVFKQSGLVCRLASEEMDKPYYIPENCPIGRYTLVYDPIDGSSNVDINLNVGSIFAIRRQEGDDLEGDATDLLQDGNASNCGRIHSLWSQHHVGLFHRQRGSCLYP